MPERPETYTLHLPLLPSEWRRAKWAARRMKRANGTPASLADWAAQAIRAKLPPAGIPRDERSQPQFPGTPPEQTAPADSGSTEEKDTQ